MSLDLVRPDPVRVRPHIVQELDHRLDVRDTRDVAKDDRLAGEEARGEDRQGTVLVAGRLNPTVEWPAALDHEGLGCPSDDGGLGHRGSLPPSWKPHANAPGRR